MRHANGEYRTIDWNGADLLDDPSVNGYVLNGGDVTEARQAAEDLVDRTRRSPGGVEDQVAVRLDDEPRDPHPHERRDRAHRAPPPDRPRRGAGRACLRREGLGGEPAGDHQRHLGLLEDRSRQDGDRGVSARPAGCGRRRRTHLGRNGTREGHRAPRRRPAGPAVGVARGWHADPAGPAQLRRQRREVHLGGRGGHTAQCSPPELGPGGDPLRRGRHGRGHRSGRPGPLVQCLRPGGLLHDATVRRHRARPDHQPAIGRAHGRQARAHQQPRGRDRRSGSSCRFAGPKRRRPPTRTGIPGRSRASAPWSSTTTRPTGGSSGSSCSPGASRLSRRRTASRRWSSRSPRPRTARDSTSACSTSTCPAWTASSWPGL